MKTAIMGVCAALLACTALSTNASAVPLGLENYSVDLATFLLDVPEASTITYNWDTNRLLVGGDENRWHEYSTDGVATSYITMPSYRDTESVAYIGNNQYVVGQERIMTMSKVSQTIGEPDSRYYTGAKDAPKFAIEGGASIGNTGLEGIAYDRATGNFFAVKETDPQKVWLLSNVVFEADADGGTGTVTELFDASLLGLETLSDIALLESGNLLIVSAISDLMLEVTQTGSIVGSFDLTTISPNGDDCNIEGVTVDGEGNIYLVGEECNGGAFYRLSSSVVDVPEPATSALMIGGIGLLAAARRRRKAEGKAVAA